MILPSFSFRWHSSASSVAHKKRVFHVHNGGIPRIKAKISQNFLPHAYSRFAILVQARGRVDTNGKLQLRKYGVDFSFELIKTLCVHLCLLWVIASAEAGLVAQDDN